MSILREGNGQEMVVRGVLAYRTAVEYRVYRRRCVVCLNSAIYKYTSHPIQVQVYNKEQKDAQPHLDPEAVPPKAQLICRARVHHMHSWVNLQRRKPRAVHVAHCGEPAHPLTMPFLAPPLVLHL